MGYFGALVANTATAKEASLPRVGRGILYFSDFVGPYWLFIPAFGLLVGAYYPLASAFRRSQDNGRSLAALLALPVAGALNAAYIIAMGGDYVHARLLIAPFFAVCVPVATVPLARKYLISLAVIPWAMVCALSFRSPDGGHWTGAFIAVTGHGNVAPTADLNELGRENHCGPRSRVSTPSSASRAYPNASMSFRPRVSTRRSSPHHGSAPSPTNWAPGSSSSTCWDWPTR